MGETIQKFLTREYTTIVDAMYLIDKNGYGLIFVVDEGLHLLGCASDGDIRRSIIKDGDLSKPIGDVMNKTPIYVRKEDRIDGSVWRKRGRISVLPVVDVDGVLTDVKFNPDCLDDEIGKKQKDIIAGTDVIIMAGGKGTRLYPYTKILPKPLIPIGDIPILERIMNRFYNYGLAEFYLTVNYKKEMIRSYFAESNVPYHIHYAEEDRPLGTAGSIKLVKKQFMQPVIVTNCDVLIKADYADIYEKHVESKSAMTVVAASKHVEIPYGVLCTSEGGVITSIEEKPKHFYFVNTGMYVINPEYIDWIPDDTFYHMPQLVEKLIEVKHAKGNISSAIIIDRYVGGWNCNRKTKR
jgi:choline kinase